MPRPSEAKWGEEHGKSGRHLIVVTMSQNDPGSTNRQANVRVGTKRVPKESETWLIAKHERAQGCARELANRACMHVHILFSHKHYYSLTTLSAHAHMHMHTLSHAHTHTHTTYARVHAFPCKRTHTQAQILARLHTHTL